MERSSQVLLRNAPKLNQGSVLLVNPPRDSLWRQLVSGGKPARITTQDFGDYRWFRGAGAEAAFEVVPEKIETSDSVILNLPREKDRLAMLLHAISDSMPESAKLWVVGENHAGIKSAGRHINRFFTTVTKLDSARHCGLFEAFGPRKEQPFDLAAYPLVWPVDFCGKRINVVSLPGVFAHGRLDKGSELLLQVLENTNLSGNVLDFACGSGIIGCCLIKAGKAARITLLDVAAPAIESSRLTMAANGINGVLLPSDGLSELSGQYDWIISNPPFHRGVSNDLEIAAEFFSLSGTFLTENGRIVIVCNRHLPYTSWLQNHFERVTRLGENEQFLILQAERPCKS